MLPFVAAVILSTSAPVAVQTCQDGYVRPASEPCPGTARNPAEQPAEAEDAEDVLRYSCLPIMSPGGPVPAGYPEEIAIAKRKSGLTFTLEGYDESFWAKGPKLDDAFLARGSGGSTLRYEYHGIFSNDTDNDALLVLMSKPTPPRQLSAPPLVYLCRVED